MKRLLDPIVVGVDESGRSLAALSWAARQAALDTRPLCLLHVRREPYIPLVAVESGLVVPVDPREEAEDVQQVLNRSLDAVRAWEPDVDVLARAELGSPASLLLAQTSSAAMVVVGHHGERSWGDLLTGTTSGSLVARAHGAVVVVNGQPAWPDARIVVGLEDPAAEGAALRFGLDVAVRRKVTLHVHRILRPRRAWRRPRRDDATRVGALVDAIAARHPRLDVRVTAATGDPTTVFAEGAVGAQLLVVGARSCRTTTGHGRRALIRVAPCPVAVVGDGCRRRGGV